MIVSSTRDVHHLDIYPSPPFPSEDLPDNVTMAADPSCFTVEGVMFGITSADILFHLGREEISAPPRSGDRLRRS